MTPHAASRSLAQDHVYTGSVANIDHDIAGCRELESLYRLVVERSVGLKGLLEMDAPEIIVRNEIGMLLAALDDLL